MVKVVDKSVLSRTYYLSNMDHHVKTRLRTDALLYNYEAEATEPINSKYLHLEDDSGEEDMLQAKRQRYLHRLVSAMLLISCTSLGTALYIAWRVQTSHNVLGSGSETSFTKSISNSKEPQ